MIVIDIISVLIYITNKMKFKLTNYAFKYIFC